MAQWVNGPKIRTSPSRRTEAHLLGTQIWAAYAPERRARHLLWRLLLGRRSRPDVVGTDANAPINTGGLIADALHPVPEAPEVSVSVTARRRFPLHVLRTRIQELQ